jgi:threonine dehydratase
MTPTPVLLADVEAARARIAGITTRTPVLLADADALADGFELQCKCESLQRTGSFKLRGLYNRIATLDPQRRARGIVTLSAGNAGAAAALASRLHGVPCVVVMPADGVPRKVRAITDLGAETVLVPERAALEHVVERLQHERGLEFVHSYDDPAVIAGQGTVALELLEQVEDVDVLVVPTGGGGLLAGCAVVLGALRPSVRLIAAEAEGAATLAPSLSAGRVVQRAQVATIADGLATSTYGRHTFPLVADVVEESVTVGDAEILRAMATAWEYLRLAIEPASAVALAAVQRRAPALAGLRVAVVLSGGNVEPGLLRMALRGTAWD